MLESLSASEEEVSSLNTEITMRLERERTGGRSREAQRRVPGRLSENVRGARAEGCQKEGWGGDNKS